MNILDVSKLKELITEWRKDASEKFSHSIDTYEKLRTGELPQADHLIYSVYENNAAGCALNSCAAQLKAFIDTLE